MKTLRKLLVVANLILVPLVAVTPTQTGQIIGAVAVGCNAAANYLIKEGD